MNVSRVSKLLFSIVVVLALLVGAVGFSPDLQGRIQRFSYIVTKRLKVEADATFQGDITQTGDSTVTGDLTVTGDTTLGDAAGDTVAVTGDVVVTGWRDGTTGYDYFQTIEGVVTGAGSGAKTYGLYIDLERTVANTNGNIDDAGMKLRYKNSADSRVVGIVQTGADIEAKNDDGHNTGTLRGASITAVTDAGGDTDTQVALRAHNEIAATATITTVQVADFELNRKSTNEPTTEYGVNLRNTSSAGTGADVGYRLESSFGAGGATANADWVYGLDLYPADIVTADIRLSNGETIANTTDGYIDIGGNVIVTGGADDDSANYDYWFTIEGLMTGVNNKDRNFGLRIDMEREAGQEITTGDHYEAALKIAILTKAVTTTSGTTMRAIDAEAKADNPSGTVSNLYGASITAKSDTGAGSVVNMIALTAHANNNAAVTGELMAGDFNLYRQAATEPGEEYGIQVRSTSSTGSGADAAIYVNSEYVGSATTDSFNYGLDISGAAINTADIRLENGETISNQTDPAVQISGFLALEEAPVLDLSAGATITATVASYQPITSQSTGSIDTDGTTAISDGPVPGAILMICNEDSQDIVVKDGANTKIGGDKTLTGGNVDCLTLLWDGSDWLGLAFHDN